MDTPDEKDSMYLETDILPTLAGTDQVKYVFFIKKVKPHDENHRLSLKQSNHIQKFKKIRQESFKQPTGGLL